MKKYIFIILLALLMPFQSKVCAAETAGYNFSHIGFHKSSELNPETEIRKIFNNYPKYTNSHDLTKLMNLYDDSYRSSDGYSKVKLEEIAKETWRDYPNVKYYLNVLSIDVDVDNATVLTSEKICGTSDATVSQVPGKGYIDSESKAIYYLKRFSNEWKIISDFVVSEKTSIKYGAAKYIPMKLDAPSIVSPSEDYTAIIKVIMPQNYVSLISIGNENITHPIEPSAPVFRELRQNGIQERILTSNNGDKNENAVASVGIAKISSAKGIQTVSLEGIAFLSSRVNVIKHKIEDVKKDADSTN